MTANIYFNMKGLLQRKGYIIRLCVHITLKSTPKFFEQVQCSATNLQIPKVYNSRKRRIALCKVLVFGLFFNEKDLTVRTNYTQCTPRQVDKRIPQLQRISLSKNSRYNGFSQNPLTKDLKFYVERINRSKAYYLIKLLTERSVDVVLVQETHCADNEKRLKTYVKFLDTPWQQLPSIQVMELPLTLVMTSTKFKITKPVLKGKPMSSV